MTAPGEETGIYPHDYCAIERDRVEKIEDELQRLEDRLDSISAKVYFIIGGATVGGFAGGLIGSFLIARLSFK